MDSPKPLNPLTAKIHYVSQTFLSMLSNQLASYSYSSNMINTQHFTVMMAQMIAQGLFQQFIACNNHMQSPALFLNILKFCLFLPKFSSILPFFTPFFVLFLRNQRTLTFQNRPCCCFEILNFSKTLTLTSIF